MSPSFPDSEFNQLGLFTLDIASLSTTPEQDAADITPAATVQPEVTEILHSGMMSHVTESIAPDPPTPLSVNIPIAAAPPPETETLAIAPDPSPNPASGEDAGETELPEPIAPAIFPAGTDAELPEWLESIADTMAPFDAGTTLSELPESIAAPLPNSSQVEQVGAWSEESEAVKAEAAIAADQPAPVDDADDGLLDATTLDTLVEFLNVASTAEDLEDLDWLTPEQKRQVWVELPADTRQRLKELRGSSPAVAPTPASATTEPEVGGSENAIAPTTPLNPSTEPTSPQPPDPEEPAWSPPFTGEVGDRVALLAVKPHLSKAELLAVFEVVGVSSDRLRVKVKAEAVGIKVYPASWLELFPKQPTSPRVWKQRSAEEEEAFWQDVARVFKLRWETVE